MEYQDYFGFAISKELIFGNGSIKYIPEILKDKLKVNKPLIVADPGVIKTDIVADFFKNLERENIPFELFDQVEPEPPIENVLDCVEGAKGNGHDSIVAIGGGSAIDLAKVASCILKYGGDIRDYLGQENVPGETMPIVAVPSTSGTGSEVSAGAILSDVKTNTKVGVRSNHFRPRFAVLDPELTFSCPKSVTASAGFDVLAHAVGSYTMADHKCMPKGTVIFYGSNPFAEPLAIAAIKLVGQYLRTAVHEGHNREARGKMMLASLLAGAAFSNTGVTMGHNITYPVAGITHAPHGVLLAVILPAVLEFNIPVRMERLAHIAVLLGENVEGLSTENAAKRGIEAIRSLIGDIQLPSTLSELGVKEQDIPGMAEKAMPVLSALPWNPRATSLEDLIEVYNRAY
jgi:alcohol dehydrogenase class IV